MNNEFDEIVRRSELKAWISFKKVCKTFLGCHCLENFKEVGPIAEMLNTYKTLGCKMSLKVHFSESHLDFSHKHLRDVSDEHGEPFHQDISVMENRYKGKWSVSNDKHDKTFCTKAITIIDNFKKSWAIPIIDKSQFLKAISVIDKLSPINFSDKC